MADPKNSPREKNSGLPPELSLEGLRKKEVSPLNDPVWRFLLLVAGGCVLGWAVPAVFGLRALLGLVVTAVLLVAAWIISVRLLLLESRAKKFWLLWLAVGIVPLLAITDTSGGWIASIFSFFFLFFRRYRPYRHLTAQRQRWLLLIGIVVFILLTIAWPSFDIARKTNVPQDKTQTTAPLGGGITVRGYAFLDYGLSSLCFFWFFSLFNLFFGIRLHFMRLKPKLAVSAFLIAIIPILLIISLGMITVYSLLGQSRALKARAILKDWASFSVRDENFIPALAERWILYKKAASGEIKIESKGEKPAWLDEFLSVFETQRLALPDIATEESALYLWIKGEVWLMDLSRLDDAYPRWLGGQVDPVILNRLSKILDCEVGLYQTNPINLFSLTRKEPETITLDKAQIEKTIKEKLLEEELKKKTSPPPAQEFSWQRSLYFGMSHLEVIAFDSGKFSKSSLLLTVKSPPGHVFSELFSKKDPLTQVVLGLLICIGIIFLIIEGLALFFGVRITRGITQAVNALHRGTRRIAEGDLDTAIEIPNQDEFGDLAFSFNQMAAAVKRGREEAIARGVLERELETARQIQLKLLPHEMPRVQGFEICGISLPSRQVGGDYFDFIETETGELGIAIGDVSGKGMPAALLMANVQASLHAQVIKTGGVAEMVSRMNHLLVQSTDSNMFVTFFCGYLNRAKSSLTWANAGHNPPLLIRSNGQVERLESGGLMLGFLSDQSYPQKVTAIQPGDILILYTDGITEASAPLEGEKRERFGDQRLIDTVLAGRTKSAPEIQAAILRAVSSFTADTPQEDDITLVIVKRTAP